MIKTIIFDFGGIFSENVSAWKTMYKRISEKTGLTIYELDKIFNEHWVEISVGKKDFIDLLGIFSFQSRNKVTQNELLKIYSSDTKIFEDVLEIVKILRKKGFRLIILSNESKTGEKIRLRLIENFVDKIYSSATLRMRKPDPKIFRYILSEENTKPDEILMIDDKERNIIAAKQLGIKGIVYKSSQQLKEDLRKYIN